MTQPEPTPRPWKTATTNLGSIAVVVADYGKEVDGTVYAPVPIARMGVGAKRDADQALADAEWLCKAANCHDQLVAAAEFALDLLNSVHLGGDLASTLPSSLAEAKALLKQTLAGAT